MRIVVLPPERRSRRRPCRQAIVWIGITALTALHATSCTPTILGPDPDTGFSLLVVKGPIQPVVREGEVNTAPVAGAVVRIRDQRSAGEARVRTAADGRARVSLRAGSYRVDVIECPGALLLPPPVGASVVPGSLTELEFDCDTGIR